MAIRRFLTWALIGSAILGLSGCGRISPKTPPVRVAATVNGQKILGTEYFAALRLASGPAVMHQLALQKVILQEAQRSQITVSDEEIKDQLEEIEGRTKDPEELAVLKEAARSRRLARKLALKDITEDTKRRFYDLFQDELVEFEVFDLLAPDYQEAQEFLKALRRASAGRKFEDLAATSSLDLRSKKKGGRLGFLRISAIHQALGPQAAQAILNLHSRGGAKGADGLLCDHPVPFPRRGFLVLKVGAVHATYDDLKESIEGIMVEAGHQEQTYRLLSKAKISAPRPSESPSPAVAASPGRQK